MFGQPTTRHSVAQEDYIKAISKLDNGDDPIAISRLATELGVTPPSVSGMLHRLVEEGLVEHVPRAGVRLSNKGRQLALNIHRRHRLVETFLVRMLGLDWADVHEEAEALEHHLSDRLVRAIDRVLGHPRFDPHGHPIPTPSGEVEERDLIPLETLAEGEEAIIREVPSEEPERMRLWQDLNLVPGRRVRVLERRELEGVWRLEVEGRTVMTGLPAVTGLGVERAGPAALPGRDARV